MFSIRLTLSADGSDVVEDVTLPEVPGIGDLVQIQRKGLREPEVYKIISRRFNVVFDEDMQDEAESNLVLVEVKKYPSAKPFNWKAV